MRPILSLKTLYRSPVRTLLTFILLAIVTFAFFSQVAEYAVTAREFNNATQQYCGIGAVEISPAMPSRVDYGHYLYADPRLDKIYPDSGFGPYLRYEPLTQEQITTISAFPYITLADTRYMTAGVSDTYYRLDEKLLYNYALRCVVEGTVGFESQNPYFFFLDDCKLLAGNPDFPFDHGRIRVFPGSSNAGGGGWMGNYRLIVAYPPDYKYDVEYIKNMTPGSRYVCVLRFEPLAQEHQKYAYDYYLSGDLTYSWCDAVWPVDGAPDNYLETDKFAPLRELVELTNADVHTFDMVYTEDMSAITRFASGNMAIIDGRALNKDDSASDSEVCVVSKEVADANHIKVGDTITMKLGTELFEQYIGIGAVAATRERYKPASKTVTLEIVGIYSDLDGRLSETIKPNWNYSINTVFVPKSLLPVDGAALADHTFSPAEFSFKVENAWDIKLFLSEVAPKIEEMGLKLMFDDDGWPDIENAFRAARQIAILKIAVLSAALTAATGFVVYLFIGRKKKEYAVMRALGTTKKTAKWALVLPLTAVAIVAVLAGSTAAWIYTVRTISQSNTLILLKEYAVGTSIPAEAVVGCMTGEILLTLIIAILLLRRIGKQPPLALLQDHVRNNSRKRDKTQRQMPEHSEAAVRTAPPVTMSSTGRINSKFPQDGDPVLNSTVIGTHENTRRKRQTTSFGFVLRYIWKHMCRLGGKSALAALLAALLFIGVGQLALMKQSYTRLCAETVITAKFVGGLLNSEVPQIMQSGYVKNPFYEAMVTVDLNSIATNLVFTNNIPRSIGEEADITYADGYDASVMDTFGKVIIAGKALLENDGLKVGDTISVMPQGFVNLLEQMYITEYKKSHMDKTVTDEEILAQYQGEIATLVNAVTQTYTIVGVVTTSSGFYDNMAFTPGDSNSRISVGEPIKLEAAEFTLSDNSRADEFRSYGEKKASSTAGVVFVMDTSELEHLRNTLRLLNTMYPIAVTAALLIGGFLCCLVIVQSSKEAAIMRVLGTTKRRTQTMLALEQIILSISGLVIGACALHIYKRQALSVISAQLGLYAIFYFAVILIGAVICSAAATRRNVLELLQTKE